jgi:hypothetical protein
MYQGFVLMVSGSEESTVSLLNIVLSMIKGTEGEPVSMLSVTVAMTYLIFGAGAVILWLLSIKGIFTPKKAVDLSTPATLLTMISFGALFFVANSWNELFPWLTGLVEIKSATQMVSAEVIDFGNLSYGFIAVVALAVLTLVLKNIVHKKLSEGVLAVHDGHGSVKEGGMQNQSSTAWVYPVLTATSVASATSFYALTQINVSGYGAIGKTPLSFAIDNLHDYISGTGDIMWVPMIGGVCFLIAIIVGIVFTSVMLNGRYSKGFGCIVAGLSLAGSVAVLASLIMINQDFLVNNPDYSAESVLSPYAPDLAILALNVGIALALIAVAVMYKGNRRKHMQGGK